MDPMENIRTRVTLNEHGLSNVGSSDFPGNYAGFDDAWCLKKFKKKFKIDITRKSGMELEFDMIGVDAAIANAYRRILLAEVPTMAIDKVIISNNTSLIQDEVLAHRLGLIPFKCDARLFDYRQSDDANGTEHDTLNFDLKVICKTNPAAKDSTDEDDKYINHKVYSNLFKWKPLGSQADLYKREAVGPVHPDILIAKMRPGQEIDVTVQLMKGKGQDHAKFSPVATASYRLLPEIILLSPVVEDEADRLQKCFAPGVIGIENVNGKRTAVVTDARKDTCTREVLRDEELKKKVRLQRVRDHFIFSIESTGALEPDVLMQESVKILISKCDYFLNELEEQLPGAQR